ncbi:MAG: type III toxin-antitoxin system ToxN/AbiQ family toxin [Acutalibacteraceae bacterium]
MKIAFYYVSPEYIDYLKKSEIAQRGYTCVPNVIYANRNKFVYGAIFSVNSIDYYVPISHSLTNKSESVVIRNKSGNKKLGTLRFNYMFPIPNSELQYLDVGNGNFSLQEINRIKQELSFCRKHRDALMKKAQETYLKICNGNDMQLIKNSCDFKILEAACIEFIRLRNTEHSKTVENTSPNNLPEEKNNSQNRNFAISRNMMKNDINRNHQVQSDQNKQQIHQKPKR